MKEENIRSDWNHALESVEGGCSLSYAIGWGFTQQDLIVLCALHRAGKHQQKIVDLLEDCNMHGSNHERQGLRRKNYDR